MVCFFMASLQPSALTPGNSRLNEHPGDYANFNSYQPRDGAQAITKLARCLCTHRVLA